MLSVMKLDARQAPVDRSFNRSNIFLLQSAQQVKRRLIISECLTFGATLLAMILWGAVLLLFAA